MKRKEVTENIRKVNTDVLYAKLCDLLVERNMLFNKAAKNVKLINYYGELIKPVFEELNRRRFFEENKKNK